MVFVVFKYYFNPINSSLLFSRFSNENQIIVFIWLWYFITIKLPISQHNNTITISTRKGHIRLYKHSLKLSRYELSNIQIYEKDNYSS